MKALSIRQPWAWAILHAGKRIENRFWRAVPRSVIGETFLIHSSAGCTRDEYFEAARWMREGPLGGLGRYAGEVIPRELPELGTLPRGAIVGRARLADAVRVTEGGHQPSPRLMGPDTAGPLCILCHDLPRGRCRRPDPWAVPGALGLVLAGVEELIEPIPHKGALGFFDVPDHVLRMPDHVLRGAQFRLAP